MTIKQRRWRRGTSLCAYCGVNVGATGDHVVPDCLYTDEARRALQLPMVTVPACEACNGDKQPHDSLLQHYLVTDVDAGKHPEAQRLLVTKMVEAVDTNRAPLLNRYGEGLFVPDPKSKGRREWLYQIPIDEEALLTAVRYQVRGLHYLVIGETKRNDEVSAKLVKREERTQLRNRLSRPALAEALDHYTQGEAFSVAWGAGTGYAYWYLWFFGAVLFVGRSVISAPLHGPTMPPLAFGENST